MSTERLLETAPGVVEPRYGKAVQFEETDRTLTIAVDLLPGSCFGMTEADEEHPAHDTVSKRYRHLNSFQQECSSLSFTVARCQERFFRSCLRHEPTLA